MRARIAMVLLVACVLTFLQSAGGSACAYPGSTVSPAPCCCCTEVTAGCAGMSCTAPETDAQPAPLDLLGGLPSLEVPMPRVMDAPGFESGFPAAPAFAPAPLALASHPPPLSVSCILLI